MGLAGCGHAGGHMKSVLTYEFTWPDGRVETVEETGRLQILPILATGADLTGIFLNGVKLAPKSDENP